MVEPENLLIEIESRLRSRLRPYHLGVSDIGNEAGRRKIDIEIVSPLFDEVLDTDRRRDMVVHSLANLPALADLTLIIRTKSLLELL